MCTGRKKRSAVVTELLDNEDISARIEPSSANLQSSNMDEDELTSHLSSHESEREARLLNGLLYWITTTTTSTVLAYSTTVSIATVNCTPAGATLCA